MVSKFLEFCWAMYVPLMLVAFALADLNHRHQLDALQVKVDNLIYEVSYEKRLNNYDEYINSQYWKPKLWPLIEKGDNDDGEYGKIVDEAHSHWFSDGWAERDYKQFTQKYEDGRKYE